jgi:cell division protein FtsW
MLRLGHVIALCALALLMLGVVMVNSASMRVHMVTPGAPAAVAPAVITPESIMFSRSTVYMALALAAMGVGAALPVRQLTNRLSGSTVNTGSPFAGLVPLAIAAAAMVGLCALAYLPVIGREINGSHRWVGIPGTGKGAEGLTMQPSELAKWGMVILLAWYATSRASIIHRFWTGLIPALIIVGSVAGFIVLEDLGTGALIAAVACVMLLAGGARLWQFLIFIPFALAGFVAAVVTSEYRMKRITAFMDPYADPEKTGYHMIQSLIAIANGNGFGRGLGHGLQKFDYLPEDRTDFIFAIICEELGIAGAGIVIALFLVIVWTGLAIVRREPNLLLRLFVLGVISTIGLQAVINLAVVTGLAPTKGIALPLLSSGGTGWILTAFSLGLVIAVERTQTHATGIDPSTDSHSAPTPSIA